MRDKLYTNQYRGRAGRKERARHFRREFDRIEAAFTAAQSRLISTFNTITTIEVTSEAVLLDPANGLFQEITLTEDTLIQIKNPVPDNDPTDDETDAVRTRLTVLVHGANVRVINGWGPQTWKESGTYDWIWLNTGTAGRASMLLDFWWDGTAWCCVASSRNELVEFSTNVENRFEANFPLISDLFDETGQLELSLARDSHAVTVDENRNWFIVPSNDPRFSGARYVRNLVADSGDLTGAAWDRTDAAVQIDAGEGPNAEDVSRITFSAVGGLVRTWHLINHGRPANNADPFRIAVSFKARMQTGTSGSMRVVASRMGRTDLTRPQHERIGVQLTDEWQTFGHVFVLENVANSWPAMWRTNINVPRQLLGVAFESPAGAVGDPVQVVDVQVELLKLNEDSIPSEFQETSFGSSIDLAKTSGSTGAWANGSKSMDLDLEEYVDFQDSLEIGKEYLCVPSNTGGGTANIEMGDNLLVWKSYNGAGATDGQYIAEAPFTFQYDGGVFLFRNLDRPTSSYTINIYEVTGASENLGTDNLSTIDPTTRVLTYAAGPAISSQLLDGLIVEQVGSTNLVPQDKYRSFWNWTVSNLVPSTWDTEDNRGFFSSYRGEYGIDGKLGTGTLLQDRTTSGVGYIQLDITVPDDANQYWFSMFIRDTFDAAGNEIVVPQYTRRHSAASQFLDIAMAFTGGSTEVNGNFSQRVRYDLRSRSQLSQSGIRTEPQLVYDDFQVFDFIEWSRLQYAISNNNTGNTTLSIRIYPCGRTKTTSDLIGIDYNNGARGWVIVDWAQVTANDTAPRSPAVGGETRAAEVVTISLPDQNLLSQNLDVIGSIESNTWEYDAVGAAYRNVLVSDAVVSDTILGSSEAMHEFGPLDEACVGTLDDEDGEPILGEAGGEELCTETSTPEIFPLSKNLSLFTFDYNNNSRLGFSYPYNNIVTTVDTSDYQHNITLHRTNTSSFVNWNEPVGFTGYSFSGGYYNEAFPVSPMCRRTSSYPQGTMHAAFQPSTAYPGFSAWFCRAEVATGSYCVMNVGNDNDDGGFYVEAHGTDDPDYPSKLVLHVRNSTAYEEFELGDYAYESQWENVDTLDFLFVSWDKDEGEFQYALNTGTISTWAPNNPPGDFTTPNSDAPGNLTFGARSVDGDNSVADIGRFVVSQMAWWDIQIPSSIVNSDLWNAGLGNYSYRFTELGGAVGAFTTYGDTYEWLPASEDNIYWADVDPRYTNLNSYSGEYSPGSNPEFYGNFIDSWAGPVNAIEKRIGNSYYLQASDMFNGEPFGGGTISTNFDPVIEDSNSDFCLIMVMGVQESNSAGTMLDGNGSASNGWAISFEAGLDTDVFEYTTSAESGTLTTGAVEIVEGHAYVVTIRRKDDIIYLMIDGVDIANTGTLTGSFTDNDIAQLGARISGVSTIDIHDGPLMKRILAWPGALTDAELLAVHTELASLASKPDKPAADNEILNSRHPAGTSWTVSNLTDNNEPDIFGNTTATDRLFDQSNTLYGNTTQTVTGFLTGERATLRLFVYWDRGNSGLAGSEPSRFAAYQLEESNGGTEIILWVNPADLDTWEESNTGGYTYEVRRLLPMDKWYEVLIEMPALAGNADLTFTLYPCRGSTWQTPDATLTQSGSQASVNNVELYRDLTIDDIPSRLGTRVTTHP